MIGYKKCIYFDVDSAGTKVKEALVTLEIPDGATVICPVNFLGGRRLRKLRCKAAKVLDIVDVETREPVPCAFSAHSMGMYFVHITYMDPNKRSRVPATICTYVKGKMVVADSLDDNELAECSHGIHFFLTEIEAVNYNI